jgi:hypothetical protein
MGAMMRSHPPRTVLVIASLLALAACQDPDVGDPCKVGWGAEPKPDALCDPSGFERDPEVNRDVACFSVAADFFESGNFRCDNLVCIISPVAVAKTEYDRVPGTGYCSKPCVSNQDCFQSETGLVCRQMVLDEAFIKQLEQNDPSLLQRYLGEVQFSSYCAVP